jgi:large subunit ribosomal protein L5e
LISITLITFLIQGALDGGLDIPHSEKRFVGFSKEDKSLNAETHCKYILGGHIADCTKEEETEKYEAHFSGLLKEGFEADDLAEMYTSVHAAICADPSAQLTEKNAPTEKKM